MQGKLYSTITCWNGVAWGCYLCKKYKEGIPFAQKAVELETKNVNINWSSKVCSYDTLALLYSEDGEIEEALNIASKDLDIVKELYPFDKRLLANMYYTMAYCLNKAKRYIEALPNVEQAYIIRKEKIGEEKPDTILAKELLEEIKTNLL